ncbi:MAG: hypothetical protein CL570_01970 [Alphaproteobacteria bacterium]|nr:hypothetical protein [Alphaproteobacteria bacterium]HCQ71233.1 hypothetical protein [Rhodospirillaceae bacterium]
MHRFIKSLCVMMCLAFLPVSASAGEQCYRVNEAEAEQGIRIHSELMVIGLNCQHMGMRAGHNLYGQYRQFTADHADLFASYEQTLMDYFQQTGASSPEQALNALRTKYANKISQDVATMRPDVFCARYAPRVVKAAELTHQDLKDWASTFYDDYPVSKPFCSDEVAMAGN